MKRTSVLVFFLLFLVGCSGENQEIERAMALRTSVLKAESVTFDADITADYGDKIFQFSVSCEGDKEGNLFFAALKPDEISGISGSISNSGGKLTFDDIALQFDTMADGQVTPVISPWVFLRSLRSGCLTSAGFEGELLRLSIDDSYGDDALHLDIWLDEQDIPQRAEIVYGQRRILSLDVKNFEIL